MQNLFYFKLSSINFQNYPVDFCLPQVMVFFLFLIVFVNQNSVVGRNYPVSPLFMKYLSLHSLLFCGYEAAPLSRVGAHLTHTPTGREF